MTDIILSDQDLTEETKQCFDFYPEILQTFEFYARIVMKNDRLSLLGRHLFRTLVEQSYSNCKNVLNYVRNDRQNPRNIHPSPSMVFLCGAARTGSTLLYNLLACDPKSRAPTLLDMTMPVPPLSRSDVQAQKQRHDQARRSADALNNLGYDNHEQEQQKSHPSYKYEEDVFILYQSGLLVPHLEPHNSDELATWFYDQTNKDFVYKYHRVFMEMLNRTDPPDSHWLLKTPYHGFNLETLIRHYPSALLIMTHRDLQDVFPSSIRLGLSFGGAYFDHDTNHQDAHIDRDMIIQRRIRATQVQLDRIVDFRRSHPQVPVFDVTYQDLIRNPIDIIRQIYAYFRFQWSSEFEQAMIDWLEENPQGKQGRHTYSLEEFDLNLETIQQRHQDYLKMFLRDS